VKSDAGDNMMDQSPDSYKVSWKRGDVCRRRSGTIGLVANSMPEYLEIRWNGPGAQDQVERLAAGEIDGLQRLARSEDLSPNRERTNLQNLEVIEALGTIEKAARNRTFANDREKCEADDLIRRAFATDGCDWDKRNSHVLIGLACQPTSVGMSSKLRERWHRIFCDRHSVLNRGTKTVPRLTNK
jgi:hypothetical protein